jgi:hypothetical protein
MASEILKCHHKNIFKGVNKLCFIIYWLILSQERNLSCVRSQVLYKKETSLNKEENVNSVIIMIYF